MPEIGALTPNCRVLMKFSSSLGLVFVLLLPLSITYAVNSQAADVRKPNAVTGMRPILEASEASPSERGKQLYDAGRYAEAVAVWQQAADGAVFQLAQNSTFLARAYQALGDLDNAQAAIDRSLNLLQNESQLDKAGLIVLGQTFSTQGSLYLATGNATAALESWQQAEKTYARAQDQSQADTPLKAMGLRSLGTAWQASGELETAKTLLEKSLAMSQQVGDSPNTIALTLLQLGNTTRALDADTALDYYDRGLAVRSPPCGACKISPLPS
jgi:tetratricopeptide (TPR) repeat protein